MSLSPSKLWLFIVKRYAAWKARKAVWFNARRMDTFRELRPGADIISDDEADLMGLLVETNHWKAFIKYLNIERWAAINNGLINAKDLMEIGEIKGDIGRCNKIEADMHMFFTQMQERRKSKEITDASKTSDSIAGKEETDDTHSEF